MVAGQWWGRTVIAQTFQFLVLRKEGTTVSVAASKPLEGFRGLRKTIKSL